VRFYADDNDLYVTLRVEPDGLYLDIDKLRTHRKRDAMPPKRQQPQRATERSSQVSEQFELAVLLQHILEVFDDFEQTFRADPKAMVSIKPGYKGAGIQVGVNFDGEWTNATSTSVLGAILQYHEEVLAEQPPPTPLKKGGRAATQE
jgi:hypothetical protein